MKKDKMTIAAELAILNGTALTWRHHWALWKTKLIQLLGALIMEKDDDGTLVVSLGRISWWIVFLPAVGIWLASGGQLKAGQALKDISPNHMNMLLVLAGYNFSKKVTDTAKMFIGSRGASQTQTQQPYKPQPLPAQPSNDDSANDPKPPTGRWE